MKSILSKTIATAVVAAGVMAVPAVASAAGPVAGCGKGQMLLTVQQTIEMIDWRIYSVDERAELEPIVRGLDQNLDDHLCVKQFKPNKGQDKHWGATDLGYSEYIVTAMGDNKAQGRIP